MLLLLVFFLSADNELDAVGRAQARAGTTLVADPALSAAAQCLAKIGRGGRALSTTVTRYCADLNGVYDGVLLPILGQASAGQDLTETLELFFKREAAPRKLTHYGAASIRGDGSKTLALLASLRRGSLVIDQQSKERLDFRANVVAGYKNLRAVVTDPHGVVQSVPLSQGKGSVALKSPGRYQLEMLADANDGPHVVANRAIFAGIAPPAQPPAEGSISHEPLEARLLSLMNAARKSVGAPALALNVALSKVALAHAKEMRDKGYFAHHSASGATLTDRLKSAHISYLRAAENLSAAPSADDAHESLMASPGHRKNILEPQLREVGIGVVSNPLTGGDPSYLFVVDFITSPGASSPRDVREAILTAMNQVRAQAGRPPLKPDTALSALAERHSQAMASNDELGYVPSQEALFAEAQRVFAAERYDADLYATSDPSTVRKSQNITKDVQRIGIGIASSASARFGSGVHWVTVLYGR